MALHSVSPELFSEWERWSAQSEKYKPSECEYIWHRFHENRGITISASRNSGGTATLGGWAKEDGWRSPFETNQKSENHINAAQPSQHHVDDTAQTPEEPYYPCLQEYKRWYFEARETGRSQKYLDRIQALAEEFKAKTPASIADPTVRNPDVPLSMAALTHLKQDAANYYSKFEQFAQDTKTILKYKGTLVLVDGKPTYQYSSHKHNYQLCYHCTDKRMIVEKEEQAILHYQDGKVQLAQKAVVREDFDRFSQEATRLREHANRLPISFELKSVQPKDYDR
jgi:hypothetical protein